jgi:hypothetical protein
MAKNTDSELTPEERDRKKLHAFWQEQITESRTDLEGWHKQGQQVVDRYLDKRGRGDKKARRLNIFTSNTNNLLAALFARIPQPEVSRRFKNPNDHAGRVASNILQHILITESQTETAYSTTAKDIIKDRLIPGAGFAWVRYVADKKSEEQSFQITDDANEELSEEQGASPVITDEHVTAEHIHWKDILWKKARTWNEVTWIARRAYMTEDEVKERFPNSKKLDVAPSDDDKKFADSDEPHSASDIEVWEIWDKDSKRVIFWCDNADEVLEVKDDPYGLPHFFPTPKPLFANTTSSKFVPSPDYALVQDQYEELNVLNNRKLELVKACKATGAYDSSFPELKNILEAPDNTLTPVSNFGAFSEAGGMSGAMQFVPIAQYAAAIQQIDTAMAVIKAQISELTGISDIVRGSTGQYETLGAQEMKQSYTSMRFQSMQAEVAEFLSELEGIKAFLIAKFYAPETMVRKAGNLPQADFMYVEAALGLLKDELLSHINVVVSVDSLTAPNDQRVMQQKQQVMASLQGLISAGWPMVEQNPKTAPLFLTMVKSTVAGMPGAKDLEGAIDQELEKLFANPPQDKLDAKAQQEQMAAQKAQQDAQAKAQMEQAKLEHQKQGDIAKMTAQLEMKKLELASKERLEQAKIQNSTLAGKAQLMLSGQNKKAELELKGRELAIKERELRLKEVEFNATHNGVIDTSELELPAGSGMASQRELTEQRFLEAIQQSAAQTQAALAQQQESFNNMLMALANQPKPPVSFHVERDASGRMVNVVETTH